MHKNKSILQLIPSQITTQDISFFKIAQSAWPYVAQMKPLEREEISSLLGIPERFGDYLGNRENYKKLCNSLMQREKESLPNFTKSRYYWSHNIHRGVFGFIQLQIPDTNKDVVGIGYAVLSAYRNQGLATKSLNAFSKTIFGMGITNYICSEVPIDSSNQASLRVLAKAGFLDAAEGVCCLSNHPLYRDKQVKRFLKARNGTIPHIWPIPARG